MRPSDEARLGIRVLLGLQLATSLAGIALLERVGPVVGRLLADNVASTEAVEEMLEVLAAGGPPGGSANPPDAEAHFRAALARAQANVTQREETGPLEAIDRSATAAVAGDAGARQDVVAALRALGAINRAAMQEADRTAMRLTSAGAWAIAGMGFLGFLVSLVVSRRLERRLVAPIVEADMVLAAARAGDTRRRCAPIADDVDARRLLGNLDWALDRRDATPEPQREDPALRAALVASLDALVPRPAVLADAGGGVFAVNERALAEQVDCARIASASARGETPDGWCVTALGEAGALAIRDA
jgi:hypothetical protein